MHRIYAILALVSWTILLWPFPNEVFLAACFACILSPHYNKLLTKVSKKMAITYITIGLCFAIILPITIVVVMITPQAIAGLQLLDDLQKSNWFHGTELQEYINYIDSWLRILPGLEGGVTQLSSELTGFLAGAIKTLVSKSLGIAGSTMGVLVRICILISLSIIGILHAHSFLSFCTTITHIPNAVVLRFVQTIRNAISSILWGVVLVAIIQGILCGIGFMVAKIPGAIFWGLVAALVAPIPFVGTGMVWLPICIYAWFSISKTVAISLILWCVIIVVGADNVLRPLFLSDGLKTSFIIVLISILCGMVALGPIGIVAGPVLVAFALQAAKEAKNEEYL